MFGFGKKKNSGRAEAKPITADDSASRWNSLQNEQFRGGDHEGERRVASLARQERKITRFFSSGDMGVINEHDVNLQPGEERHVLGEMQSGRIDRGSERHLLLSIKDPVDLAGSDRVFARMGGDKHFCRIIATITGRGFDNWQSVSEDDMMEFRKRFPTPIDFEAARADFMGMIQDHNTPEKYQEYVESMSSFEHTLYGKRQEYYDALQDMHQKASDMTEEIRQDEPARQPERGGMTERPLTISEMSHGEQQEVLRESVIEGDPFQYGGREYQLSAEQLAQSDLGPAYRVRFDDADISLSKRFRIGSREAVIGYVKGDDGAVHVRSYYRSNSQGVWRFLPDYVPKRNESGSITGIEWYGKGYDEESLTLPAEMQQAMAALDRHPQAQIGDSIPEYFFVGTAQQYQSKDEYSRAKHLGKLRNSVYDEIASRPAVQFAGSPVDYYPPERVQPNGAGQEPDFGKRQSEFATRSSMYGQIRVKCYPSKDGKLMYSFNEDSDGRAWIGGIETRSKINSAGLRSEWVEGGNLGTPLYEYSSQDGGYGDRMDTRGPYRCMWNNYLRHIPIIRKYKQFN